MLLILLVYNYQKRYIVFFYDNISIVSTNDYFMSSLLYMLYNS